MVRPMSHIVCCACSAVNRLPANRPANASKCGKCGARLFSGQPRDVSAGELDIQVGRSDIPVLVDVWAPWCGPCRTMAPAYEAAAKELESEFRLLKLNSEAEPNAAGRLRVQGIPTLILFRGGQEAARISGAMPAARIVAWAKTQAGEAKPHDR